MARFPHLTRRALIAGAGGLGAAALMPRPLFAQAPRRGGSIQVAYTPEQRNLNTAMIATNGSFIVASKVIEPLVDASYEGDGLRPLLATSWAGAADGRSITFNLRQGVKWHDGKEFSSADVAYNAIEIWKKLQNFGRILFKDLEAVETPDAVTAVFRFAKPIPLQLVLNALPDLSSVVPKHLYEGTDIANNPHNLDLVGTGPFRWAEYRRGEFVRLERNQSYWDSPKPYLDQIVFRVMPEAAAIASAHEAGELQLSVFTAVPTGDIARLGKVPGLEVVAKGYENIPYQANIEFNFRKPELANPKVRYAIHHALDSAKVVETVFQGYAKPATGPVPTTSKLFYTPEVQRYAFDPKRAEALLDEAGYKRGPDGMRFALKLSPAPWFEQTRQLGDYVRQALRQIGIDAGLQAFDTPAHLKAVYTDHAFEMATGSTVFRSDPAISTTVLYESGIAPGAFWSNQFGYANPKMDEIIAKAAGELDAGRRVALYKDFQKLATQDLPIIHLVDFSFLSVASAKLMGHHNTPRWACTAWADTWLAA
ncbi:MAG: ABC transporter substrate-binding protein [Proteobacteria bacterium]|nr:ABC transporter substrate-binding protein [Pseudomonadota bacterium]